MRLLHWLAFAAAVLGVAISAFLLSPYNARAYQASFVNLVPASCGAVRFMNSGLTWPLIKSYNAGNGTQLVTEPKLTPLVGYTAPTSYRIDRAFLNFDLSMFPANTVFNDAQLCIYKNAPQGYPYPIYVVEGTQESTSTLSVNDFSSWTTNVLGTITTSTNYQFSCFSLTNTSTLVGGTWVKMALIENHDFNNIEPTVYHSFQNYCDHSTDIYRRPYLKFDVQVPKQYETYYKNMATSTLVYAATQGARSGTQGFYVVFGIVAAAALFGCGYYMLWSRRS